MSEKDICGSTDTTTGEPCQWNEKEDSMCPYHNDGGVSNVGRPSKLEKYSDLIIRRLDAGMSLGEATKDVNVARGTVHNWITKAKENPDSAYSEFLSDLKSTVWWETKDKYAPGDSRKRVYCETCGDDKFVYPWRYDKFDKHYCDKHHPTASGEDSPNWKDNSRAYMGPQWETQRKKALVRDDYTCVSCGKNDKQHREEYDQGLHVHHIIPRSEFDDSDPKQNDLTNLVTLCRDCHEMYEGTNLSPVEGVTA